MGLMCIWGFVNLKTLHDFFKVQNIHLLSINFNDLSVDEPWITTIQSGAYDQTGYLQYRD